MRLLKHLNEAAKGDTSLTTVSHEIATAIFLVKPNEKLVTGADLARNMLGTGARVRAAITTNNKNVAPLSDPELQKLPQFRHFTQDVVLDSSTIEDARKLANGIRSIVGAPKDKKSVYWTGPTNDSSKYGSADITYITNKGVQPVSLKKGAGQLKNLGLKTFSSSLLKGIIGAKENFAKLIYSHSSVWNRLTGEWVDLNLEALSKAGDSDLADMIKQYNYSDYDTYSKAKMTEEELQEFRSRGYGRSGKVGSSVFLKDILAGVYQGGDNTNFDSKKWGVAKATAFDSIFKNYFEGKEAQLNQNLLEIFKKQMSSGSLDMWYAAKGGKKILFIPNEDTFARTADGMEFDIESKSEASGYIITLYATPKSSNKKLAIIDIMLRWKQGQLVNSVSTASNLRKVEVEDWNKLFRI